MVGKEVKQEKEVGKRRNRRGRRIKIYMYKTL